MILQYLVIDNIEELDRAEKLGIDEPKRKFTTRRLVVDINDIGSMYLNRDNHIEIEVRGYFYELEFNQEVWDAIETNINAREISK